MKGSEVFWEVALNIDKDHQYCCDNIISLSDSNVQFKLFTKYFKPGRAKAGDPWFGTKGQFWFLWEAEGIYKGVVNLNQTHRVLAMLFMELIWEDENE